MSYICRYCDWRPDPRIVKRLGQTLEHALKVHEGYHILAGDKKKSEMEDPPSTAQGSH